MSDTKPRAMGERCRPCQAGRHDRCRHPFIGEGADFCCCVDLTIDEPDDDGGEGDG